jgi:hypothetical protein
MQSPLVLNVARVTVLVFEEWFAHPLEAGASRTEQEVIQVGIIDEEWVSLAYV